MRGRRPGPRPAGAARARRRPRRHGRGDRRRLVAAGPGPARRGRPSRPRPRRPPRSSCRWSPCPGGRGEARLLVGRVGDTPAVVRAQVVPVADAVDGRPAAAEPVPQGALGEPLVAPAGGVLDAGPVRPAAGRLRGPAESDVPVVASWTWTEQREGEPAEGLTGVPVDRAWVEAVPAGTPWRAPVVLPLAALQAEPGALRRGAARAAPRHRGARSGPRRRPRRGGRGARVPRRRPAGGGAPLTLPGGLLLEGLDPAAVGVGAGGLGDRRAPRPAGAVPDADGALVASTSVPGPRPAARRRSGSSATERPGVPAPGGRGARSRPRGRPRRRRDGSISSGERASRAATCSTTTSWTSRGRSSSARASTGRR